MSPEMPVREPLAIIGIGCRFPGDATSPQSFWDLLVGGVDATRDLPGDRWEVSKFYDPDAAKVGKTNTCHGGFLERVDEFDAQFFGISPREAIWLDPQQRLLMQATWEALEDGGQVPAHLEGSDTGVFMGGFTLDYFLLQNTGVYNRYYLQANSATGMMMTMLANRLSYAFDLRGPSITVDTACSGSLVAVHLAAQSIWNGECSLAIAGGANVMLAPTMMIAESKGGFLSPDGRCKTFDASADGYARGEGAGVVVLKRLSQARRDGDPIYALLRGTGVSQDGHTTGITVPNPDAQIAAMRRAYEQAGVDPRQVSYVEAHGTGTPVGDPLEAAALGAVLGDGRTEQERLLVGSVKTNIGHLEAAAGIAGLTKVALALKHGRIPAHLNLREPNPDIDFADLGLRVPLETEQWPSGTEPRLAGINSFGFGGTNAHAVLEQAPPQDAPTPRADAGDRAYVVPVSARSPEALRAAAESYRDYLRTTPEHLGDIVYSASQRRSHHEHRLAAAGRTKAQIAEALEAHLAGEPTAAVTTGQVGDPRTSGVVFVCSGMGPQWWAMGRELLAREPVFAAAIERCDAALRTYTGWSLLEAMLADEQSSRMAETEVAQPANFAIQVALAELWRSWGVEPDAVVGHSTGEVAAQYLSGALSFEDAIRVTYYRSSLQQRTTGQGRMLAVGMTRETLDQTVREIGPEVSIAAINSPSAITLSGDAAALEALAEQMDTHGVFHRFLTVKVPYHSHAMDPLRTELLDGLAPLQPRPTSISLYSTVTGTRIEGTSVDADYWWQNVRRTVLFEAAFTQMLADGYTTFVELGPHPVLSGSMRELLAQEEVDGAVIASLRRGEPEDVVMRSAWGALHAHGHEVSWERFTDPASRFVSLPTYPWQLKRFWHETDEAREDRHYAQVHPLLGQRSSAPRPTWEREISASRVPYLQDHAVQGVVVLPGAAYLEMALAAARELYGTVGIAVEGLSLRTALLLSAGADARLRTVVDTDTGQVQISSYLPSESGASPWTVHATAQLRRCQSAAPARRQHELSGADVSLGRAEISARTEQMGFAYGPLFRALDQVDGAGNRAVGRVRVPDGLLAPDDEHVFHPALVDAAFQVLLVGADVPDDASPGPYLPVGIERFRVHGSPVPEMTVSATVRQADATVIVSDLEIRDPQGRLLVEIEGFRARSLESSGRLAPERLDKSLYELAWHAEDLPAPDHEPGAEQEQDEGRWLILADAGGVGAALAEHLSASGGRATVVEHAAVDAVAERQGGYVVDRDSAEQVTRLVELLADQDDPVTTVVCLWGLDAGFTAECPPEVIEADQRSGALAVLHLAQSLSRAGWEPSARLWLVTRNAQPVGGVAEDVSVSQASLWGLGRVIGHQELTASWGGLIDLDDAPATDAARAIVAEIGTGQDDQVAHRDGQRHVARLVPSDHLATALPTALRADGSYLVTGGFGALGLVVARHLVRSGARRLILMGRSPVPERSTWPDLGPDDPQRARVDAIRELEQLGATVHVAAVDVADEAALASWLEGYAREGWPPIRGVVHSAGSVHDELLVRMSDEDFQRVMRPKVLGGWALHRVLADQPLDLFVLFSSTGSVIASPGQANYAAANAFLDALAHHRRAQGRPSLSIGWGPWSVGMVTELELEAFYARRGISLITPEEGTAILGRVLGQQPAHLVAITADWAVARAASPTRVPPMFSLLEVQDQPEGGAEEGALLATLADTPADQREAVLVQHLRSEAGLVLGMAATELDEQVALTSLGLDSMMAVEVKVRIETALRVEVSVLELLQGMSVAGLAAHLMSRLRLDEHGDHPAELQDGALSPEEIERLLADSSQEELERLLAELEAADATGSAS